MAWTKKPAAPDYLNQLATFRVALTGTADDWLLPWINLVDWGNALDVNAFCALGPPEHPVFTVDDFLAGIVGGPVGAGVTVLGLREKIRQRAQEILFAELCENVLTTGQSCDLLYADVTQLDGPFAEISAPVPVNTTHIRIHLITNYTGGAHDIHLYWFTEAHANVGESDPPGGRAFGVVPGYIDFPIIAGGRTFSCWTNGTGAHWRFEACHPGSLEEFTPDEIEQPATAIAPTPGTYTTIADLGAELDAIEQKLHWVLNFTTGKLTSDINPLIADESIEIADPDADVELGPDVMGFIVTLSAIPGSADERFGSPLQLHKLGRVVMGNGTAWLPPIDLSVSPMLLLRPDPTVTKCRVHTFPPTTATVTTLVRAPAVG